MATTKKKVLVQAGHVEPQQKGHEGQTGTTREQEFTFKMAKLLVKMLDDDGRFDGIYCPGAIPSGIKVDAAIFQHGDGSASKAASGFCFGYPTFAVNKKLADLISTEYLKLPGHPPKGKDNYTRNLSGYYGFGVVDTPGPEVLVESGFLTNPSEQAWMFANIDEMASAQYRALLAFFSLAVPVDNKGWKKGDPIWQNLPGPKPKPSWFWTAVEEMEKRKKL
jgi:N-acetylmuramoyl-L-alanine amidase